MANITKRINKKGEVSYRIKVFIGCDAMGKQQTQSFTWKPPTDLSSKQMEKEAQRQAFLFDERVREDRRQGL